jgi:hypothetical protein
MLTPEAVLPPVFEVLQKPNLLRIRMQRIDLSVREAGKERGVVQARKHPRGNPRAEYNFI